MKRALKILSVLVVLLVVAWVALQVAQRAAPPVSGPIVLPDGSWVRLEAVTYGTNHLVGPPLAHLAERMPQSIRSLMVRIIGRPAAMRFSATTSSPKLVLWLNRGIMATPFPASTGYLECVLSDLSGATSGDKIPYEARYPLEVKEFAVFPRRAPEITLSIYYHDPTGAVFKRGSVAFANPLYRRYPEWKPEPLPATKRAGDVAVTLEKISTGHGENCEVKRPGGGGQEISFGTNRLDGGNTTVCVLHLRPLANSNEVWRVTQVITSDATGNQIGSVKLGGDCEQGFITFSPALWPGEAWKLNLEILRTEGFTSGELFTFRDVPLGALNTTNRLGWTTNCNGVTVTLEYFLRRPPPADPNNWSFSEVSQVRLAMPGLTNDLHLNLLSARIRTGPVPNINSWGGTGTNRSFYFREIPTNATTADFTFAVQRSRRVEFLVQPETGVLKLEISGGR